MRVRSSLLAVLLAIVLTRAADAEPVPVRFTESLSRGFLVLRNPKGDVLADGELLQVPRGGEIENRLTFRFRDGSLWDEIVTFTQHKVFRLMSYRHVQRGPSFPGASDVAFDRKTGRYRAKVGDETAQGTVELPEDLYNGMASTLMKNLPPGARSAGHLLVFTPTPHMLDTEIRVEGEDRYLVGEAARTATRYLMKMELRGVTRLIASVLGKDPPEVRYWIATGPAPAFVKFEGPMFLKGPPWRIELSAPRWPER